LAKGVHVHFFQSKNLHEGKDLGKKVGERASEAGKGWKQEPRHPGETKGGKWLHGKGSATRGGSPGSLEKRKGENLGKKGKL